MANDPIELIKLKTIENDVRKDRHTISYNDTPSHQVKTRPDGLDYIEEAYMRYMLNKAYPLWSWRIDGMDFLGHEWVTVRGTLTITEQGIERHFGSVGGVRIQFKKGKKHDLENIIDIDKNVASANTDALKRAINRLCNIGDDIYRKRVYEPIDTEQLEELKNLAKDDDTKQKLGVAAERLQIHQHNFDEYVELLTKEKTNE